MSYHLLGDFETANSILETFRQSQSLNVSDTDSSFSMSYHRTIIFILHLLTGNVRLQAQ